MWLMLQQEEPEDYVLSTGVTTAVRDFIRMAFAEVGIEISFSGTGIHEKGIVEKCNNPLYQIEKGKQVVGVDSRYFRPAEVDMLIGDSSKARKNLGWQPKYDLAGLVKDMMEKEILFQQINHY